MAVSGLWSRAHVWAWHQCNGQCHSSDGIMIQLTLFDPRNFRFAESGSRSKCDSSGENVDTSDSEEYIEQEHDDALEWNEAKHWFHDQEQELEFDSEFQDVNLKSLKWIATLGVGGFGRVELVTLGANRNNAFALKKMKKSEVCGKLAILK